MVGITEISAMMAASSVAIGVIYYVLQFRHQNKVRQTDLVMKLYSTFGGEELQQAALKILLLENKDYNDFVEKYGPPSSGDQFKWRLSRSCISLSRQESSCRESS